LPRGGQPLGVTEDRLGLWCAEADVLFWATDEFEIITIAAMSSRFARRIRILEAAAVIDLA